MPRSSSSFLKKQKADKKAKKRKEKLNNKIGKKDNPTSGKLEDMLAYIDENGNITNTPPTPRSSE